MSTSTLKDAAAQMIVVQDDRLVLELTDGRSVAVPLSWFPRLVHATPTELNHWRMIGKGEGVHWPDLDEDISVASLLEGRPSSESAESLRKWLQGRTGPKNPILATF